MTCGLRHRRHLPHEKCRRIAELMGRKQLWPRTGHDSQPCRHVKKRAFDQVLRHPGPRDRQIGHRPKRHEPTQTDLVQLRIQRDGPPLGRGGHLAMPPQRAGIMARCIGHAEGADRYQKRIELQAEIDKGLRKRQRLRIGSARVQTDLGQAELTQQCRGPPPLHVAQIGVTLGLQRTPVALYRDLVEPDCPQRRVKAEVGARRVKLHRRGAIVWPQAARPYLERGTERPQRAILVRLKPQRRRQGRIKQCKPGQRRALRRDIGCRRILNRDGHPCRPAVTRTVIGQGQRRHIGPPRQNRRLSAQTGGAAAQIDGERGIINGPVSTRPRILEIDDQPPGPDLLQRLQRRTLEHLIELLQQFRQRARPLLARICPGIGPGKGHRDGAIGRAAQCDLRAGQGDLLWQDLLSQDQPARRHQRFDHWNPRNGQAHRILQFGIGHAYARMQIDAHRHRDRAKAKPATLEHR